MEAADELAVVQAIVAATVRLGHAGDWGEHYYHDDLDDLNDGNDHDCVDDDRLPDDDEAVVIGQDVLLRGKGNRVPGQHDQHDQSFLTINIINLTDIILIFFLSPALGLAVVVPLNLGLLDYKTWRFCRLRNNYEGRGYKSHGNGVFIWIIP